MVPSFLKLLQSPGSPILSGPSFSESLDDTSSSILLLETGVLQASYPRPLYIFPSTPMHSIAVHTMLTLQFPSLDDACLQTSLSCITNVLLNSSTWTSHKNCKQHMKNLVHLSLKTCLSFSDPDLREWQQNTLKLSKPHAITPSNISSAFYDPLSPLDKTAVFLLPFFYPFYIYQST